MYLNKATLQRPDMVNDKNLLQKCKIQGLKLTPDSVRKVKSTIEYNCIQLDSLMIFHQEKIKSKLIDDEFFLPETIAVIEYKGNSYAVKSVKV
ncbi:MAG: hypothetical protein V3V00_09730 [Saprospiraceae bacterium]